MEILEPTGADTLVHITLNGQGINCRVDPHHAVDAGQTMPLMMDVGKAVLFDPQTEARLG